MDEKNLSALILSNDTEINNEIDTEQILEINIVMNKEGDVKFNYKINDSIPKSCIFYIIHGTFNKIISKLQSEL